MTIFQLSGDVVQTPHATHQHTQHDHTRHKRSLFIYPLCFRNPTVWLGSQTLLLKRFFRAFSLIQFVSPLGHWQVGSLWHRVQKELELGLQAGVEARGGSRRRGGSEPIL